MKTYKTWEVIKMLSKNPKLIFEDGVNRKLTLDNNENITVINDLGQDIKNHCLTLDREWRLVKPEPKPVSFMEAMSAYNIKKKILCKSGWGDFIYDGEKYFDVGLQNNDGNDLTISEILDGKWYIVEDNENE